MNKNQVLVTGATGFIGKALCRILESEKISFISHKVVNLDVTKVDTFRFNGSNDVSKVVHLAGKTFVPDSWKSPEEFIHQNTIGTLNVAEFCKVQNAHLIYISAYIYGNPQKNPIDENQPTNVNNPYALSKRLGEEICLFYQEFYNVKVTIVRPFNVYGPGQNGLFLIPEVVNQVKAGKEIRVKDLSPKRDFIYVDDVARIILKILESGKQGIYNAGSGRSYSVKELIDCIQLVAGTSLNVSSENEFRTNEISDTVADITKAVVDLGWAPEIDLLSGIRKTLF